MSELFLIFPALAILCAPALYFVLGKPRWLRSGERKTNGLETISIVIPARDEEKNLPHLLTSLGENQEDVHEIIVVDDQSSDRTGEIACEFGARVIEPAAPPEGWRGKSWACTQGAQLATGKWLLFLDADTVLESGAMDCFQALAASGEGAYSVCPWHRVERVDEGLSAFFNVLMLAGSQAFSALGQASPCLFGQCLLVSKSDYEKVGTHAVVRDRVLENVSLTSFLREAKIPVNSFLGKGMVTMRMFPEGLGQLCRSWLKGASEGVAGSGRTALILSSVWLTGLMFTIVSLSLLALLSANHLFAGATLLAYGLGFLQCWYAFRLAGGFSFWNALFFPAALLFYQGLFFAGVIQKKRGRTTTWKGRTV